LHGFFIADVFLKEYVIFTAFIDADIVSVSAVCQRIKIDNPDFVSVFLHEIVNVIGADETGAACD